MPVTEREKMERWAGERDPAGAKICRYCGEDLRESGKVFICPEHGQQAWKRVCVICGRPFVSTGSFAAKYCPKHDRNEIRRWRYAMKRGT